MDPERVDRYVIAGWVLPFWWIAAGFGAVATPVAVPLDCRLGRVAFSSGVAPPQSQPRA